jgi:hypothetical protein
LWAATQKQDAKQTVGRDPGDGVEAAVSLSAKKLLGIAVSEVLDHGDRGLEEVRQCQIRLQTDKQSRR